MKCCYKRSMLANDTIIEIPENEEPTSLRAVMKKIRHQLNAAPEIEVFLQKAKRQRSCGVDLLFVLVAFGLGLMLVALYALALPLIALAGTVCIVAALSAVSSLTHESWHGHLSNNPQINDFLSQWILSPLLVADYLPQRRNHLFHHSYLGEDKDPDGMLYRMSTREFVTMVARRFLIVPYLLKILGVQKESSASIASEGHSLLASKAALMRIALVHGLWILALLGLAAWVSLSIMQIGTALFLGYMLPLLLASTMIALRGHRKHTYDAASGYTITYNTQCSFVERWLVSGGYFNLHVCHHLFPEIPQHRLTDFLRLLEAKTAFRDYYWMPKTIIFAKPSYFTAHP